MVKILSIENWKYHLSPKHTFHIPTAPFNNMHYEILHRDRGSFHILMLSLVDSDEPIMRVNSRTQSQTCNNIRAWRHSRAFYTRKKNKLKTTRQRKTLRSDNRRKQEHAHIHKQTNGTQSQGWDAEHECNRIAELQAFSNAERVQDKCSLSLVSLWFVGFTWHKSTRRVFFFFSRTYKEGKMTRDSWGRELCCSSRSHLWQTKKRVFGLAKYLLLHTRSVYMENNYEQWWTAGRVGEEPWHHGGRKVWSKAQLFTAAGISKWLIIALNNFIIVMVYVVSDFHASLPMLQTPIYLNNIMMCMAKGRYKNRAAKKAVRRNNNK